ncbi:hypothetical protein IWW43_006761, partial [Coemansia sp. RSA 1935]
MIFGLKFHGVRTVVTGSVRRSDSRMTAVIANEPAITKGELVDEPADAQAELVDESADGQTDLADEPNIAQANLVGKPADGQTDLADEPNIAQAEFIIVDSELQRDPCTITNLAREIAATQAELIALDCKSQSNSEATVVNDEELADTLVEPKENSGIKNIIAKLMADVAARHARVQAERATKLQAVRAEFKIYRE